jgi:hypothetical protein
MTSMGFSNFYVFIANGDNNRNTNSGDNIYIQDFQVEQGLVATDYIETGASSAQAGILEDMPRLDYSGGASCPSLLLEPQRLNKMYQSEYLRVGSGASGAFDWSNTYVTLTSNNATSPDGYQNATKMETTSANGSAESYVSYTASSTNTMSLFVKAGTSSSFSLFHIATGGTGEVTFNLTNGTFTRRDELDSSATITDYGNDWWRITMTYTAGTGAYISRLRVNGVGYVHIFGWQIEEGSYPTSYIPTYGTSQTRSADDSSLTGVSDLYGSTQGVVFLQTGDCFNNSDTSPTKSFLRIEKDANNYFSISSGGANATPSIRFVTNIAGSVSTDAEPAGLSNSKIAIRYTEDDFKIYQNGVLQSTISKSIGGYEDIFFMVNSGDDMKMPLKQFLLFPTALTDSECIALTTL